MWENGMRRRSRHTKSAKRVFGGLLTMAMVLAVACPAALASRAVYVEGHYQPALIVVKQGGDYHHVSVHGLTWTHWNQPMASGQGTYTFQFCTPELGPCTDAIFYDAPVLVRLSGIAICKGRASYTKLQVTPNSSTPNTLLKAFRSNVGS
ncbi:MAG TPA: hypothetical protein VNX67_06850, partial [Solirubrobacteraceae bacterium]|nr:hypothetical protein [Solirubrobacteraceae bacterium]